MFKMFNRLNTIHKSPQAPSAFAFFFSLKILMSFSRNGTASAQLLKKIQFVKSLGSVKDAVVKQMKNR